MPVVVFDGVMTAAPTLIWLHSAPPWTPLLHEIGTGTLPIRRSLIRQKAPHLGTFSLSKIILSWTNWSPSK